MKKSKLGREQGAIDVHGNLVRRQTVLNGRFKCQTFLQGSEIVGILHWQAFEGRTAEKNEPTHLPVLDSFLWQSAINRVLEKPLHGIVNNIPSLSTGSGCSTDKCECLRHTPPMWKGYVLQMVKDKD